MADLLASDRFAVHSHRGDYEVIFAEGAVAALDRQPSDGAFFLIDERVAALHRARLPAILDSDHVLLLAANEGSKSLDRFPGYVEALVAKGVRRNHTLVAIGGGVVQDISSFLAATLFRGMPWRFYPTTLLAQADSCIGSKSSINVGSHKNILGTFTPPAQIFVDGEMLATLDEIDVRSGIGEILKVHAIDGPASFDGVAADYSRLLTDPQVLAGYIRASLQIKRAIIEEDEFDRGRRQVMNYGHTFGHAIEAATAFGVPHGIAITIGMEMANHVGVQLGISHPRDRDRMGGVLATNAGTYRSMSIPEQEFLDALARDKKHSATHYRLILPNQNGRIETHDVSDRKSVAQACLAFLRNVRS